MIEFGWKNAILIMEDTTIMNDRITEFYRIDPLTGSNNFLSFVETLDRLSARDEKSQFSILYTDLNHFYTVNETRGHAFGDTIIRWLEIVLREECNAPTYRIGGDDFAVVLADGLHAEHEELVNRLYSRLNREGQQLGIPTPPATIALIHFDGRNEFPINDVMFHLWETIYDVKENLGRTINIYQAQSLIKSTTGVNGQNHDNDYAWNKLCYIANNAISRIVGMGMALDDAQKNSYLDSISGLPNMRAALYKIEKTVQEATTSGKPFSILLIDGDNLRKFNSISYATGDEAIRKMGDVLSEHLRPGDFVARWRTGDEFIVLLPDTSGQGARVVGERFCAATREASKSWPFPASISIGIAVYPQQGSRVHELVDAAEAANKHAKDQGKDRVVLAE
jgi:diguanylate cyclase (GGDEF)-like protein